jgi:hypothetical protein
LPAFALVAASTSFCFSSLVIGAFGAAFVALSLAAAAPAVVAAAPVVPLVASATSFCFSW